MIAIDSPALDRSVLLKLEANSLAVDQGKVQKRKRRGDEGGVVMLFM